MGRVWIDGLQCRGAGVQKYGNDVQKYVCEVKRSEECIVLVGEGMLHSANAL
jgi:hypothetical protein